VTLAALLLILPEIAVPGIVAEAVTALAPLPSR
jgi:hypothetical protein